MSMLIGLERKMHSWKRVQAIDAYTYYEPWNRM